jgi:hypothetical protein
LVPAFDGASLSSDSKDALWAKLHQALRLKAALSLLMGDAPEKRVTTTPVRWGVAGNLPDVMQAVEQAEAELASRPATLDVAVLQRRLAQAHIPYVLLIDGCLEDPNYAQARDRSGIVVDAHGGEPVYVGPGDAGSALRAQLEELRNYPTDFPYFKGKDPIVLGANPGTAAYAETNPIWQLGAPVGPIARRLSDVVARTRWSSDRPSLIRILDFTAERQEIGPQELVGIVSWSDWLPYLKKFDPQLFQR